MVEEQLRARGVKNDRVLDAMMTIPRERFVPPGQRGQAYEDRALPIGQGQTISQPFIVAYMTAQLEPWPNHRVLEIGTGTGYQTAILAMLSGHVYTIERITALQQDGIEVLASLNLHNITFATGDGSVGLIDTAPYDRILVTAAAPKVPGPLIDQLVDGGCLVVPVGTTKEQTLIRVVRKGKRTIETRMLGCRFVKLIGTEGWSANEV